MLYFSDNITSWNFKDDVASFMESEDEPGAVFWPEMWMIRNLLAYVNWMNEGR